MHCAVFSDWLHDLALLAIDNINGQPRLGGLWHDSGRPGHPIGRGEDGAGAHSNKLRPRPGDPKQGIGGAGRVCSPGAAIRRSEDGAAADGDELAAGPGDGVEVLGAATVIAPGDAVLRGNDRAALSHCHELRAGPGDTAQGVACAAGLRDPVIAIQGRVDRSGGTDCDISAAGKGNASESVEYRYIQTCDRNDRGLQSPVDAVR